MQIGNVVRLKAGGPKMTVNAISETHAKCKWFDGAQLCSEDFALANLELVPMTEGTTHIFQVMDGSGSMRGIWEEIQGMMEKQREVHADAVNDGQDVRLTTFLFDDEIYPPIVECGNPMSTPKFRDITLPGGMTALRDAIGQAIKMAKVQFKNQPNEAVLIQIFTDGQENMSTEWTHEAIHDEIKRLQDTGKWTFQFIGANQIAENTALDLGINVRNAVAFRPTTGGVKGMSLGLEGSTRSYYSARAAGAQSVDNSFGDGDEKMFDEDGSTTKSDTQPTSENEDNEST